LSLNHEERLDLDKKNEREGSLALMNVSNRGANGVFLIVMDLLTHAKEEGWHRYKDTLISIIVHAM
jgi:hypothetical protein